MSRDQDDIETPLGRRARINALALHSPVLHRIIQAGYVNREPWEATMERAVILLAHANGQLADDLIAYGERYGALQRP